MISNGRPRRAAVSSTGTSSRTLKIFLSQMKMKGSWNSVVSFVRSVAK